MADKSNLEVQHQAKIRTYLAAGKTRSIAEDLASADLGIDNTVHKAFVENARVARNDPTFVQACLTAKADITKIL